MASTQDLVKALDRFLPILQKIRETAKRHPEELEGLKQHFDAEKAIDVLGTCEEKLFSLTGYGTPHKEWIRGNLQESLAGHIREIVKREN